MTEVTEYTAKIGMVVSRGPDWAWGNQDEGKAGKITALDHSDSQDQKWVRVRWDGGGANSYRVGPDFFDLVSEEMDDFDIEKFNNL